MRPDSSTEATDSADTEDCIFCKIVSGAIPADRVAEHELALAFRDLTPQAPTHVLVIPKLHVPTLAELAVASPAAALAILTLARDVADAAGLVSAADGSDGTGYRLVANSGAGVGQSVFHAHVHVLGGRPMSWPPG